MCAATGTCISGVLKWPCTRCGQTRRETRLRSNLFSDRANRLLFGLGFGFLIILACGLAGYTLGSKSNLIDFSIIPDPSMGKPAPDFALLDLNGKQIQLTELIGKPVMINFWATWCGPCVTEMPYIQEQVDAHPDEFIFLAINADEPEQIVRDFILKHNFSFTVLLDPDGLVMDRYRITGYPTSFFINAEGNIQAIVIGSLDRIELSSRLHEIGVGK